MQILPNDIFISKKLTQPIVIIKIIQIIRYIGRDEYTTQCLAGGNNTHPIFTRSSLLNNYRPITDFEKILYL